MTITIRIQRRQASMGTGSILLLIAVVFSVMFQAVLLSHYYFPSHLIDTLSGNSGRQQLLLSTNHEDLMINFNSNSHIAITNTTPSSLSSSSSSNSILIDGSGSSFKNARIDIQPQAYSSSSSSLSSSTTSSSNTATVMEKKAFCDSHVAEWSEHVGSLTPMDCARMKETCGVSSCEASIDLVYLWVNGTDPQFVAKKNETLLHSLATMGETKRFNENFLEQATSGRRF